MNTTDNTREKLIADITALKNAAKNNNGAVEVVLTLLLVALEQHGEESFARFAVLYNPKAWK